MNNRRFEVFACLICLAFAIFTLNPLWMIAAALYNIATVM